MNLSKDTYLLAGDQPKIGQEVRTWLSLAYARVRNLGVNMAEGRARGREMRELHKFSDRELWDVGLSRSDIPAVQQGTYRRG